MKSYTFQVTEKVTNCETLAENIEEREEDFGAESFEEAIQSMMEEWIDYKVVGNSVADVHLVGFKHKAISLVLIHESKEFRMECLPY